MLNADDILGFSNGEVKPLTVPQWKDRPKGDTVYIRSLSHGEISEFRGACNSAGMVAILGVGDANAMQRAQDLILIQSLCDSKGTRLFKDDVEDLEKIKAIQGEDEAFEYIVEEIIIFNKILKKDRDDLDNNADEELEDIKKKLST